MADLRQNSQVEVEVEGQTITTQAPKAVASGNKPEGWNITLPDPFLGEWEDLAKAYGEGVVLDCARAQLRVKFQSAIRSMAEAGRSDQDIVATMKDWKPGTRLGLGGNPQELILKNFGNLTAEQRAILMQQLTEMAS